MTLDILNCINIERLDYMIREVGKENIRYLVMDSKTYLDLVTSDQCGHITSYMASGNKYYSKYRGLDIAIFEGLKYGEVEFVKVIKDVF